MFHSIRKKLTILYTASFLLLLLSFMVVLYFFISTAVNEEQAKELYTYFEKEREDFIEDAIEEKRSEVKYGPERAVSYYIFNESGELVKGKEVLNGFLKANAFHVVTMDKKALTTVEWNGEHILLLTNPLYEDDRRIGYVIIGKTITSQHHFIQTIIWIMVGLVVLFSIILGVMSYYLAGRAVVPIKEMFEKQKKFVSDASHELRTPVSVFFSSIEILEKEERDGLSLFGKEVVDDLKAEAYLMKSMLNDLLFLAKNDQVEWEMDSKTIDLTSLIESVTRRFSRHLPSEIQLTSDIKPGLSLAGDYDRIQQLVYILLDNALQYTKTGDIRVTAKRENSSIRMEIMDSGIGMREEDIPYIFDRFFRGDLARVGSGNGLGLAIAKTIVEGHGGIIEATSVLEKGSTFIVTLPISR